MGIHLRSVDQHRALFLTKWSFSERIKTYARYYNNHDTMLAGPGIPEGSTLPPGTLLSIVVVLGMRQSHLFTKTRKEIPADEVANSARLLLRAGFISKEMAGVYSMLPLGRMVLDKIVGIIREEMNALGGQEVSLAALQDPTIWKATNRWDDHNVDVWFKTKLKNQADVGLAFTHEEPLTRLMKDHVTSYRDLPLYVYQFQTKFRNETRAKSGLLRTREFVMKDMYSFSTTMAELDAFHERAVKAYQRIFAAVGIGDQTYKTFASGGAFSQFSDEFQTICPAGEDTIHIDRAQKIAVNHEVFTPDLLSELSLNADALEEVRAIEVGNIFKLGTRFSEALGLTYTAPDGGVLPVVMGSYGIGPARVMAAVVECLADEAGMVWPKSIAPFDLHLLELDGEKDRAVRAEANKLCAAIRQAGLTVLHDDRDRRAGEKFADSDLIGIPTRVVVSKKTLEAGKIELKDRATGEVEMLNQAGLIAQLKA